MRAGFAECRKEFRPGFPFSSQELVAVGDGGLDDNPSPLGDGDRDGFDRLNRRRGVRQRRAVGLNAGKTVAGDVKPDASRRYAEPGICLIGSFGGLANAQKGVVGDPNLLGLTLRVRESLPCSLRHRSDGGAGRSTL